MASLTKIQINTIAKAVKKRLPRVKLTLGWQQIHRKFNLGEPDGVGKYLHFSARDYDELREMVRLDTGLDVLNYDFDKDRGQLAKQTHKEKFASLRPDANYVLIKAPLSLAFPPQIESSSQQRVIQSEPISVADFSILPALRLTVEQALALCVTLSIAQLVVVENLDSFDSIEQMNFDASFKAALAHTVFVYRGSGVHSPAGCKGLLQAVSEAQNLALTLGQALVQPLAIIAFTDLDPAGLQIAHLLKGCSALIAPTQQLDQSIDPLTQSSIYALTICLLEKHINDVDDFDKQFRQQAYLDKAELGAWQALAQWVKANRVSIKQQHFLAHKIPLGLVPL
jgi:hypothetical protein